MVKSHYFVSTCFQFPCTTLDCSHSMLQHFPVPFCVFLVKVLFLSAILNETHHLVHASIVSFHFSSSFMNLSIGLPTEQVECQSVETSYHVKRFLFHFVMTVLNLLVFFFSSFILCSLLCASVFEPDFYNQQWQNISIFITPFRKGKKIDCLCNAAKLASKGTRKNGKWNNCNVTNVTSPRIFWSCSFFLCAFDIIHNTSFGLCTLFYFQFHRCCSSQCKQCVCVCVFVHFANNYNQLGQMVWKIR